MLLKIETYEETVVNHRTARDCFEQFADIENPARAFWLDGASSMGKSYLLDWFERNINDCHPVFFGLQDHASIQVILLRLESELNSTGIKTPRFSEVAKPKYAPSRNEVSDIEITDSPNTTISQVIQHSQSADEMLVVYLEQLRAIVRDVKSALESHDLPRFIIMFDQMERYDYVTKDFIFRLFAPELYRFACFQFIFSGHKVTDSIRTVPLPEIRHSSLSVTLTPFTNSRDIANYLSANGSDLLASRDLDALADRILAECQGMPNLVGKFVRLLCDEKPT
ncbi:hypothetical protein [Ruegeria sp. HKCCE4150]|uniref:hypothetical protein n=1 Tax=Ruegeria sp. HKCCE4150 TaxID=2794828 RepID=UPI001AE31B97|nr:hypothetical protein [Ruegeria sp. HKCCE4150]